MPEFQLRSESKPTGDQPEAIAQLVEGLNQDMVHNGFENMPEIINGNNNRAQSPWVPITPLDP